MKFNIAALLFGFLCVLSCFVLNACYEEEIGPPPNPDREAYNQWITYTGDGESKCGYNGSPFIFFANYSEENDNLLVYLEPGGACWYDELCSPECSGMICPFNLEGLEESHINLWKGLCWLYNRDDNENVFKDWNFIFVPYCTADVHIGYSLNNYETSTGDPFQIYHYGYENLMAIERFIDANFNHIGKLVLSGSSAGGFGSLLASFHLRDNLDQVDQFYVLSDSGPVISEDSSLVGEEFATIMEVFYPDVFGSWGVDDIIDSLGLRGDIPDDYGKFYEWLGDRYPKDRFAVAVFQRDYNVSRFIIEPYVEDDSKENILAIFNNGLQGIRQILDAKPNMHYYMPYFRAVNDSHCLTIFGEDGTDIPEYNITFKQWMEGLVNDDPNWKSYLESPE